MVCDARFRALQNGTSVSGGKGLLDGTLELLTTGEQRIETVLELQKWIYPDAAEQRFIPICRIIEEERG